MDSATSFLQTTYSTYSCWSSMPRSVRQIWNWRQIGKPMVGHPTWQKQSRIVSITEQGWTGEKDTKRTGDAEWRPSTPVQLYLRCLWNKTFPIHQNLVQTEQRIKNLVSMLVQYACVSLYRCMSLSSGASDRLMQYQHHAYLAPVHCHKCQLLLTTLMKSHK